MTQEALVATVAHMPAGEARFIRPSESKGLLQQCEREGYISVDVPELRAVLRGRLAWLLEEAVERSLELRGACRSAIGAGASLESCLTDQLYRARLIGARGLLLLVPTLEGITNRAGALDSEDSATLRAWICATRRQPVRLYLDVADCMLGAYLDPITLTQLMHAETPSLQASQPLVVQWVDSVATRPNDCIDIADRAAPELCQESTPEHSGVLNGVESASHDCSEPQLAKLESGEFSIQPNTAVDPASEFGPDESSTQTISQPPDTALETPSLDSLPPAPQRVNDAHNAANETPHDLDRASDVEASAIEASHDLHRTSDVEVSAIQGSNDVEGTRDADESSLTPIFAPAATDLRRSSSPLHDVPTPSPHSPTLPAPPLAEGDSAQDPEASTLQVPLREDAPVSWRTWMERLDAVHGPKPLNFIEQSFVEHYVPLYDAYYRGIAGEECRLVLDQWAASFSQSYSEAFDAMRLRGRRPMMVLDVAETAHRLGRLHGARAVQLVLVDGMRYDLGLRVERLLSHQLAQSAVLTDRFLLWSALPSTTTQQLELLARPESLRDGDVHGETPILVARGRSASTLRRVRVGSRELLKLDLVEARLSEPGGPLTERLDQLAIEVADALTLALGKLQPRTLVTVFGDHGFCLDAKPEGTGAMRQGGASPNEVLVPAFAWLVGQTH